MKKNFGMKVKSAIFGILLFGGTMVAYAIGNALSGQGNLTHGAEQWSNNCARCHNYRPAKEFSANHWQPIMMHMRIQAGITGQEARNIFAFLANQTIISQVSAMPASTASASNTHANTTTVRSAIKQRLALNNPSSSKNLQTQTSSSATSGLSGAAVYGKSCVSCHGSNGKGAIPGAPDFTSPEGPLRNSDKVLLGRIINGYQSPGSQLAMPPRGGNPKLTDDDLRKALQYIRGQFGK